MKFFELKLLKSWVHILPYIGVFIASLFRPYDADLGWHLKYGEYFFKTGQILRNNIFSSEMPNFSWVNSSWGTDLISFSAYSLLGFFGLSFLGAVVVTLTFFFFSQAFRLQLWVQAIIFPLLVYFETPLNQVSFRGQQMSLLFLGVLLFLLSKHKENKKFLYSIPLLFLVWANVHGQFLLGLAVLFLYILFSATGTLIEKKDIVQSLSEQKKLVIVFLTSLVGVIIHPFGLGVYEESLKHFNNPLQKDIIEWNPIEVDSYLWWQHVAVGMMVILGTVLLSFEGKIKQNFVHICIAVLLLMLSISVRRYAWPAYYLSLPLLAPIALFFKPRTKKEFVTIPIIISVVFITFSLISKYPFSQFTSMEWSKYCSEYVHCSPKVTEYWAKNRHKNSLTLYNWGGYIIWNFPKSKPLIDGRMHLWRDKEGFSAFEKYYKYEQNLTDIDKSEYTQVLISPDKPIYSRLKKLVGEGKWKVDVEDEYATVFSRVEN